MNKTLQQQLQHDTAKLAMKDGRRVGQPGHAIAIEFLRSRMEEIGLDPFTGDSFLLPYGENQVATTQRFAFSTATITDDDVHEILREELAMELCGSNSTRQTGLDFCNLVGVIPGIDRTLPPLLIGAHYDSVIDAPCADDNATSVALNLAIAEAFVGSPLQRDLIIAFFDAEEPPYFHGPCMGSNRFFEDYCADIQFAGVIVTDLIGHDLDISRGLNAMNGKIPGTDAFEQAGQPFLFLSCGHGKYYHHIKDNLDWINFAKLARIAEFVRDLLAQLDLTPAGNDPNAKDPFEFESRMIQKAVGKTVGLIAKGFGHEIPKSREDIGEFVSALRQVEWRRRTC